MKSGIAAFVNVKAEIISAETQEVIAVIESHNRVVDTGIQVLRDLLCGDPIGRIKTFALGTNNLPVAAGDLKLVFETFRADFLEINKITNGLQGKYYLSSQEGNGFDFYEAGAFCGDATLDPDTGILYARVVFPQVLPKTSAISVIFTWDFTMTDDGV